MLTTIFQLLLSLSILVFIHELGHFFFARLFNTRVEKFYLFFNPYFSIFKWTSKKTGTEYGLGWVPLGGYCSIAGMIDEKYLDTGEKSKAEEYEFRSKPAWQRLLIMLGGILMNLLLAILIYTMIVFSWGTNKLSSKDLSMGMNFSNITEKVGFQDRDIILSIDGNEDINVLDNHFLNQFINSKKVTVLRDNNEINIDMPKDFMKSLLEAKGEPLISINMPMIVDSVLPNSVATDLLQKGDLIKGVNEKEDLTAEELMQELALHQNQTISLIINRNGETIYQDISLGDDAKLGIFYSPINKIYKVDKIEYNIFESIPLGIDKAIQTLSSYISSLKLIFTKEGIKQVGGLGTMGQLFSGGFDWFAFWSRTAFLSIILAVMNFLPIPALDGGHIILLIIEMIRRKSFDPKVLIKLQQIGAIFLIALMLYANLNDVYRFLIK